MILGATSLHIGIRLQSVKRVRNVWCNCSTLTINKINVFKILHVLCRDHGVNDIHFLPCLIYWLDELHTYSFHHLWWNWWNSVTFYVCIWNIDYCHIVHTDGLVQERRNSNALAMELHLSGTQTLMYIKFFTVKIKLGLYLNICNMKILKCLLNIYIYYTIGSPQVPVFSQFKLLSIIDFWDVPMDIFGSLPFRLLLNNS